MTILIGHGGASAVAPANTLESFDAALDARADMIEFDVRSRRGQLVLAHGPLAAHRGDCLELDEALAHLARPRFARVGLNVDVKTPGYERETLDALRAHSLAERALISSQCPAVIDRFRALDREMATAISVGGALARRARKWSLRDFRRAIVAALRSGRFGDVMLHHRLVDAELVAAIGRAGGRAYAWTIDDPRLLANLAAAGVAGVVTGDPHSLRAHHGCSAATPSLVA